MNQYDKLTVSFLNGMNEIEPELLKMNFRPHSIIEKGFAHYVEYKNKNDTILEFLFGPSDWDIEMIIYSSIGKFAFKDLLNIPEVNKWVNNNRYKQVDGRNLKNELLWYVKLLIISLPFIE